MIPLYEDPFFTFRFADDRIIGRIHLDGPAPGRRVVLTWLTPGDELGAPLAEAVVGEGGWVDLPAPVVVRAGEGFAARVV
ncbi:hypothetical protein [Fimbriiglobus ruber]|uniref:Uncharacterized protein n=1 Tax=Fimbriiglobus ruber TaxID=1908690 RepID=A0A225DLZ3_9BACT|nr:hypothetical protein [Fimbriiglobus ruber]OWK38229.1 hypothetical protein FRUB_07349 [Fimbriiglobus ruber]